jgi:hypothetical protein
LRGSAHAASGCGREQQLHHFNTARVLQKPLFSHEERLRPLPRPCSFRRLLLPRLDCRVNMDSSEPANRCVEVFYKPANLSSYLSSSTSHVALTLSSARSSKPSASRVYPGLLRDEWPAVRPASALCGVPPPSSACLSSWPRCSSSGDCLLCSRRPLVGTSRWVAAELLPETG